MYYDYDDNTYRDYAVDHPYYNQYWPGYGSYEEEEEEYKLAKDNMIVRFFTSDLIVNVQYDYDDYESHKFDNINEMRMLYRQLLNDGFCAI